MLTTRWPSWGAASGVVLAVLWAPMGVIVWQLPHLSSAAEIERFYRSHAALLKVALGLASVGFFFFLTFLGVLVERLRQREGSGPLTWDRLWERADVHDLAQSRLGLGRSRPVAVGGQHLGHSTGVHAAHRRIRGRRPGRARRHHLLCRRCGLSFRAGAFPRWLAWTAVLAAVVNVGALGGIFSLTGPLNAGDGAIGGPAAPILAWVVWILLASIVMLRESRRSPVMPPNHPRPVRARRPPDRCAHEHR
jgi:hypothetical protein